MVIIANGAIFELTASDNQRKQRYFYHKKRRSTKSHMNKKALMTHNHDEIQEFYR